MVVHMHVRVCACGGLPAWDLTVGFACCFIPYSKHQSSKLGACSRGFMGWSLVTRYVCVESIVGMARG